MPPARYKGNETQGDLKARVTWFGPVWAMESRIGTRISVPRSSDAFWASKLVSMAAPLHGVPSWKSTLSRTVMTQEV
jgi:hypothetical protein